MTLSRLLCAFALTHICAACDANSAQTAPAMPGSPDRERPPETGAPDSPPEATKDPEKMPEELEEEAPAVKVLGAAQSGDALSPVDATPSPDGDRIYFVATSETDDGRVASLHTAEPDGTDVQTLLRGAPLSAPVGIAVSLDGERLLVADLSASGGGAILTGSTESGELTVLPDTVGLTPRAVTVAEVKGREHVYFTGASPSGAPGVYRLDAEGGAPELLATGTPLSAPAGIAVSAEGDIYVIDALADEGSAALLRVREGEIELLVGGLGVGFPAGLTLTLAEDAALVSGLAPETRRDVVYVIDLATLEVKHITDPVGAFAEPAGLHRAHDRNVFAWADSEANGSGTVFVLSL